jgi:hypothetical protein
MDYAVPCLSVKAGVHERRQTQREEKKAIALDCWRKLKWGMKIGFSFSNQNPGGSWKGATRQPCKKN